MLIRKQNIRPLILENNISETKNTIVIEYLFYNIEQTVKLNGN